MRKRAQLKIPLQSGPASTLQQTVPQERKRFQFKMKKKLVDWSVFDWDFLFSPVHELIFQYYLKCSYIPRRDHPWVEILIVRP
jgi:hypothetical protein